MAMCEAAQEGQSQLLENRAETFSDHSNSMQKVSTTSSASSVILCFCVHRLSCCLALCLISQKAIRLQTMQ